MGPAKVTKRTMRVTIKRYDHSPNSSKIQGQAALQKVHEEYPLDDYGELIRIIHNPVAQRRTPRIPVILPADRDIVPENRGLSSTKYIDDAINKDGTNFATNESPPDGSTVVFEATQTAQVQTFLKTKGTEDAEICQIWQHSKRRRIEYNVDGCKTSKVGHETMVLGKEVNNSDGVLNLQEILKQHISADDMLILDVMDSMLNTHDKTSKLKINILSDMKQVRAPSSQELVAKKADPIMEHMPLPNRQEQPNKQVEQASNAGSVMQGQAADASSHPHMFANSSEQLQMNALQQEQLHVQSSMAGTHHTHMRLQIAERPPEAVDHALPVYTINNQLIFHAYPRERAKIKR